MDPPPEPKTLRRYATWLLALTANGLFNHEVALRVIGAINARFRWIDCVFLVYPSRRQLFRSQAVRTVLDRFRWRPVIGGAFRQGKGWGLTFAVTSSEAELIDARNAGRLRALAGRMERIRELLRADRCALAGVLPSVLASRGVSRDTAEADVAAECVLRAIQQVRHLESLHQAPVLLLGCRGFVGNRVAARLFHGRVYAIDRTETVQSQFPELGGARALLVNLTWADVLETYLDQMRSGMVVLNEVYPPPSRRCVQAMRDRGVVVYHLAGVEGFSFPPFPDAYAGGVPCCAAKINKDLKVQVVRLD
jgi:hypothetical protein